jgi:hypothetical protein
VSDGAPAPVEDLRASDLREGKRLIWIGIGAFLVVLAGLLAIGPSLAPRGAHVKGMPIAERAKAQSDGTFTATLDARDQSAWRGFDLRAGRVVDAVASDVAFKRTEASAPHGAIDLGAIDLAAARAPADAAWLADKRSGGSARSPAFGKWYRYSYTTHLLTPNGHVIAVRCADATLAYVRIDDYYCEPDGGGCVTLTWRLESVP